MDESAPSPAKLRHVLISAGIGSALEWYDFFIYGLASALVFGPLFFPSYDPTVGILASFATFAVGFLARPLADCSSVISATAGDASPCWWRPCCWSAAAHS